MWQTRMEEPVKAERGRFEDRRGARAGPMPCVGLRGRGPPRVEERRRGWREVRRASCPSTTHPREPLACPFPHSILPSHSSF